MKIRQRISVRNRILQAGTLVGLTIIASAVKLPAVQEENAYDWEVSKANLRAIGSALQLYRQQVGYLPVAERNVPKDAGLPDSLAMLQKQGFAWSLPSNKTHFLVENSKQPRAQRPKTIHYFGLYNSLPPGTPGNPVWHGAFSQRGEKIPILLDDNMYSPDEFKQAYLTGDGTKKVIILRLDGTVDEVSIPKALNSMEAMEKIVRMM